MSEDRSSNGQKSWLGKLTQAFAHEPKNRQELLELLRDAHRIRHIPGVIVHGRYDVVCPVQNAIDLHAVWPEAKLVISPASGHAAFEAENTSALVEATDSFR